MGAGCLYGHGGGGGLLAWYRKQPFLSNLSFELFAKYTFLQPVNSIIIKANKVFVIHTNRCDDEELGDASFRLTVSLS